jgi:hypothetical protein
VKRLGPQQREEVSMGFRTFAVAACFIATSSLPASAQVKKAAPFFFVDGSVLADLDATNYAIGTTAAAGFSGGARLSEQSSLRVEREMPDWHAAQYVAPRVRSLTTSILYGRHIPVNARVNVALLVGGANIEQRYSNLDFTYGGWAAAVGGEAEIGVTRHLAVVPGLRLHTYVFHMEGSTGTITRPRVALRWSF